MDSWLSCNFICTESVNDFDPSNIKWKADNRRVYPLEPMVGDILDSGLTSLSKDVRVWCRKQNSSGNVTLYVVEFVN